MRCPFCQHKDTQVIDSRAPDEGSVIRRRRKCLSCGKRFTTFERAQMIIPMIVKSDGTRMEYNRQKMLASMMLALRKRPVTFDKLEDAADFIEQHLILTGEREILSRRLGDLVLDTLARLDTVAYIRYAAVYLGVDTPNAYSVIVQKAIENNSTELDFRDKPTTEKTVEQVRLALKEVK